MSDWFPLEHSAPHHRAHQPYRNPPQASAAHAPPYEHEYEYYVDPSAAPPAAAAWAPAPAVNPNPNNQNSHVPAPRAGHHHHHHHPSAHSPAHTYMPAYDPYSYDYGYGYGYDYGYGGVSVGSGSGGGGVEEDEAEAAPDVLIIKNRGRSSTLRFPAYAIGDGLLTVGNVRDAAARQLDVTPTRRVKLLYKGRLLKEDDVPAKSAGLKQNSQILCVVAADFGSEASSSELEGGRGVGGAGAGADERLRPTTREPRDRRHSRRRGSVYEDQELLAEQPRPTRHRSPSSPRPRGRTPSSPGRAPRTLSPNMGARVSRPSSSSAAAAAPAGAAPSPSPDPSSRSPRPRGSPLASAPSPNLNTASSTSGKVELLETYFADVIEPACREYISGPPADLKTRDYEHRRLSETAMTQVLLKADEIDLDGDETARQRRKALINRVHRLLKEVDEAAKS